MHFLYNLAMYCLGFAIRLAAPLHPKAKAWVSGRKNWRARYQSAFKKSGKLLWVHAASLGEFEQGRPVIEAWRKEYPDWQIVLSFFSPSGYSIRKNYEAVDFVCYLPADTRANARDFLDLFQPDAAVFVKYEFWANYLFELKKRAVPTLLVSALFRPGQLFFQWYGAFWRQMLGCFSHIFLQNQNSVDLLRQIGFQNYTVAGDTRVDRVLRLAESAKANPVVQAFFSENGVGIRIIAGSSWPADEDILLPIIEKSKPEERKWVIAPHEPSKKHLDQLSTRLSSPFRLYSDCTENLLFPADCKVLLIDNVGMLNTLYRYGNVAYIGGGFGRGIHNTLEPAAFGLPVIFGPRYEKFEEARQFVARGGAFPVKNSAELEAVLLKLRDKSFYQKASNAVLTYLEENSGATEAIVQHLATSHFL